MTTPPPDRAALIEVMARALAKDTDDEYDINVGFGMASHCLYMARARAVLDAIEAASCVVVPADPTVEMIDAAEEMYMPFGEMIAAWDGFVGASPYRQEP